MSSLSTSFLSLLEDLKYSLLQLWSGLRVQDRGIMTIGAILGLIVLYAARYLTSPYRKLPPGPRGYPIIGNLFELMKGGQWIKFSEWQKKYGDLIYINAAGQPVVIINSPKVGVALLDRRAAIYSDRPRNIVASDIMSDGLLFAFSRYGDTFRRMRKASHERLSTGSVKGFTRRKLKKLSSRLATYLLSPRNGTEISSFCGIGVFAKGEDRQSMAAALIREAERNKLSLKERSWLAGTLYGGGSDTISTSMGFWTLAMLANPEAQARAQAELDAVVGRTRLPTFADYPHLPYIRAMIKELLRWRPIAPIITPHRVTEDDWYEGMFIPKGTICLANAWHMNRDPEIFGENAEDFEPARYLDASGDIAPGVTELKKDGHFTYGFGSRICVGRVMADNSLFINIAILLWATKIERKKDASGRLLPLDVDGWVDIGLVIRPVPFEAEITPRFPEVPAMLAQERELRAL
ncbi:cytochrome P450 [Russula aff. rugulosa BPL654]|nr:cytochrome P450 [Russula aff. rugulosa BPL654]